MNAASALGAEITGLGAPSTPARPPAAWLDECRSVIALLATRDTYAEQPELWELGEHGRARTIEDFEHHLRAARGTDRQWREYVAYCLELFDARGFPFRWLTDAFATLSRVLAEHFPADITGEVRANLDAGPALLAELAEERDIDLGRPTRYDS